MSGFGDRFGVVLCRNKRWNGYGFELLLRDFGLRQGTLLSAFPCAKDSYGMTTEMHNVFVKDVMIHRESPH